MVRIRPAAIADVEAMVGLLKELFTIEGDFEFDAAKHRRALAMMLARPEEAHVWVASQGEQVVGMCSVQCLISTAEGGPVGMVEDLVVAFAMQGRGIGRRLLQAVEDWARVNGLLRLQLLADAANRPALAFYDRCGWSATRLICRRKAQLQWMDKNAI